MMNKIWTLTIDQQSIVLKLAPPHQRANCSKCHLDKKISLLCQKRLVNDTTAIYEERQFCWACSLANLYELEQGDYEIQSMVGDQIKNKKVVIKELRAILLENKIPNSEKSEELLECYG